MHATFACASDFVRQRAVLTVARMNLSERPYREQNEKAIREFEKTYGPIRAAFEGPGPVNDKISYLRLLGFRCSACAAYVTYPIVRFFGYGPHAICYDCQKVGKR